MTVASRPAIRCRLATDRGLADLLDELRVGTIKRQDLLTGVTVAVSQDHDHFRWCGLRRCRGKGLVGKGLVGK